ncbi:SAM-dependent methyltransferase [Alphaproteobacteria bacterium GH1-50]|uniref:SAM-dependent methyltransferase n=1 Tax=Kangsaoukella pontilimi TaxID=2691042 RepID=A0A7C9NEN1_9RHOB|nr:SAM-dependent methyltransferase [Kangsaoukella pontilimi]MXQ08279.1 SAM-dependent methyltransferase [Kangsaoukella pontilimi]
MQTLTDRSALIAHRRRATMEDAFLHAEAAAEIEERLSEVNRTFTAPAVIGLSKGPFATLLPGATQLDDAPELSGSRGAHDLVVHAMSLHWADDPVGQLVQSRLLLKPDGLFIGTMFAGQTLHELRTSLAEAEARVSGGLSPRVLPMADLRDLGGLMQRAGFALPVADSQRLTVRYRTLAALCRDLRVMGETNALADRPRQFTNRRLFSTAEDIYRSHFSDDEGYLLATFEMVFLTGWAPDESQPKPLRPGSAQQRLADALGTTESPAGDTVAPRIR